MTGQEYTERFHKYKKSFFIAAIILIIVLLTSCSGITNYTRDIINGKYTIVSGSASATSLHSNNGCITGEDNKIVRIAYNKTYVFMEIVIKQGMKSKEIVFASLSLQTEEYITYTTYGMLKDSISPDLWIEYDYWLDPADIK
ncbi:MAG: hypothetical protein IJU52_02590 [Clostridia bacterium]|nr:hypothetical protein [Clostridia bacterium]